MDALALLEVLAGERARFVRFARRRVRTEADAEDIVQRALTRAAERAASLDDPARARAWFYRILRNALADHQRGAARQPAAESDVELEVVAAEPVGVPTACRCAVRLLDGLRPSYSEVLRRVDLDGEAPASVAASLGISKGNLEVRVHRARRSLRREIEGYCCVGSLRPCLDCACDGEERCGSAA